VTANRAAHDLLIACARWEPSARELGTVRERASAAVDWDAWAGLVRWHRVVPHAQRALSAAGASVPATLAESLRGETLAIAARALARAQQLAVLMRAFDADGVPALPFKGPALSLAAYGELAARASTDLDVVVAPRDVDRARETMVRCGYRSASSMSPAQERVLQRSFGHFVYAMPEGGAHVELHWRFAAPRYPWSLRVADVMARATNWECVGCAALTPEPADQVLLQVMHGTRHQWEQLEWLVTVVQLLKRSAVDEEALIARAKANGSYRALAVTLRLARGVLGAPLSPRLAGLADGGRAAVRAAEIVRTLESGTSSLREPYAFNARMMDRWDDRVRYIARGVFSPTPREWELVRLPASLVLLYYPLRIARVLVLRSARAVRALLRGARAALVRR